VYRKGKTATYVKKRERTVYTDKKENKIFRIYKENSNGIGCKVIYEEGLSNL
jgi:hypothetical protein